MLVLEESCPCKVCCEGEDWGRTERNDMCNPE